MKLTKKMSFENILHLELQEFHYQSQFDHFNDEIKILVGSLTYMLAGITNKESV